MSRRYIVNGTIVAQLVYKSPTPSTLYSTTQTTASHRRHRGGASGPGWVLEPAWAYVGARVSTQRQCSFDGLRDGRCALSFVVHHTLLCAIRYIHLPNSTFTYGQLPLGPTSQTPRARHTKQNSKRSRPPRSIDRPPP